VLQHSIYTKLNVTHTKVKTKVKTKAYATDYITEILVQRMSERAFCDFPSELNNE